jgi:4-hydroxyphenylacetate 3-monooxygenase/4-hydroxybutyryl-CoA dehydratase/vinylacetyl-CoA-Delta-isomerase
METIALNLDYNYERKKKLARYLAGIDPEFDDSADLALEPTFGTSLVEDPKDKQKK